MAQPPKSLAECTDLVNESVAALLASDLTAEQKQHVGTLANAYLYALYTSKTLGKQIENIDQRLTRVEQLRSAIASAE